MLVGAAAASVVLARVALVVSRRLLMRLGAILASGALLTVLVAIVALLALELTGLWDEPVAILLALVLSGAVATGFALCAARDLRDDLRILEDAARRIAARDLSSRVPLEGVTDLSRVGEAFNQMAEALERTERERTALERARRELIAAVSHDLRTPVASLRALSEALAEEVVREPMQVTRHLGTMSRQVAVLSGLIDDLFELARMQGAPELVIERVDLAGVVEEAVDAFRAEAAAEGVELGSQVAEGLGPVWLDPARVQRVLVNLLENSLRHTASGGSVRVLIEAHGSGVRIEVEDSGSGIPSDELPMVFEQFFTGDRARRRGTGLGLAICRAIVEAHGGEIGVRSQMGRGTTIWLTLPSRPPAADPPARPNALA